MIDAQLGAQAVIDWSTLQSASAPASLFGDPQHKIVIHWFTARTHGGMTVDLFVTEPLHPQSYYQHLPDPIDPSGNCHGETFGPHDPQGTRYNIYEGNVQDILDEGFIPIHAPNQVGARRRGCLDGAESNGSPFCPCGCRGGCSGRSSGSASNDALDEERASTPPIECRWRRCTAITKNPKSGRA